jgi:hypothetical protein
MTDAPQSHPFWTTLPGVLTGVAAVLTALVGLLALFMSGTDGPASSPQLPLAGSASDGPDESPLPSASETAESGSAAPAPPTGSPAYAGTGEDEYLLFRDSGVDVDSGQSGSGVTGAELTFVYLGYVHVYGERRVRVPEATDGPGCATALSRGVDDDSYHPTLSMRAWWSASARTRATSHGWTSAPRMTRTASR